MVRVPPPVWAMAYVLIAAGLAWLSGWRPVPGLPIAPLGVALVVAGIGLAVAAAMLFRRAGATLHPEATAHDALVTAGPFRFTRNPMYLGLLLLTLGIAIWLGAWPMFLAPLAL
jgi:protein-S-isoprenylcysteine O-methyltransferase Ste14